MKKNNKKGFTLIELLAVIVILGVIALIATPIVINVIEKAKEESYKRSVEFAMDATDYYLLEQKIDEIPSEGIEVTDLKLTNNNFKSGVIKENSKSETIAEKVSNGEYCASGRKTRLTVVKGSCDEIVEPLEIYNILPNSVTSSSITVVVDTNNESNIKGYYYAINGDAYGAMDTKNTHNFTGLNKNTKYTIKVKVEDNDNATTEETITVKTTDISEPTYKQTEEGNKVVVTITYPSPKEENWVYEYQQYTDTLSESSWTEVKDGTTATVEFTSNGKLVARVRDIGNSNNTVIASEYEVANMTYTDELLKGSDPVIKGNLIPVKIDNEGKVTKADISTKWYDYSKQEWANAVLLADGTNGSSYTDGDTIEETKIRAYFVWIPKYKYKIFDEGKYESRTSLEAKEKEIEIEFQGKNDTVSGEKKGEWLTHPAFTTLNVSGIWVGKFEVGYNQNSNTSGDIETNGWTKDKAQTTESYTENLEKKIIVKPNVNSWRNQKVNTFFKTLYEFDRDLDSHMMKNTEWGAVAYLSHSKYGKWANNLYTDKNREVYKNNSSDFYTGKSSGKPSESGSTASGTHSWNETTDRGSGQGAAGAGASTTGNITGVYDMSGGAEEYVAGYNKSLTSDKLTSGGFSQEPTKEYPNMEKYFDVYDNTTDSSSNYKTRILGDATGEMGPFNSSGYSSWYGDYAVFVISSNPWFYRGGYYSHAAGAGVFNFDIGSGNSGSNRSCRLVLSPSN